MPSPSLRCPPPTSDTGAYSLSWQGPDGATYRLRENGTVIYKGSDTASTVTGRKPGTYTYQVSVVSHDGKPCESCGSVSNPCRVKVDPPSLGFAAGLFAVGLFVFVAILTLVIRGHCAHKRGELG